jgi:hypothetical protein
MAGLVPAIHVFVVAFAGSKTWMPGTSPGMTVIYEHGLGMTIYCIRPAS